MQEDGDAVPGAPDVNLDEVGSDDGRPPYALQAVLRGVPGASSVGDDEGHGDGGRCLSQLA